MTPRRGAVVVVEFFAVNKKSSIAADSRCYQDIASGKREWRRNQSQERGEKV